MNRVRVRVRVARQRCEVEHGGKVIELKLVKVKTDTLTGLHGVFKPFSTQRGGAAFSRHDRSACPQLGRTCLNGGPSS